MAAGFLVWIEDSLRAWRKLDTLHDDRETGAEWREKQTDPLKQFAMVDAAEDLYPYGLDVTPEASAPLTTT